MKKIHKSIIRSEALIQELIELVFEKVAEASNETSGYGLAKHLHSAINEQIAERTLLRYYDGYLLKKTSEKRKPNAFNLDVLSLYLGFESYADFTLQKKSHQKKLTLTLTKKTKIISATIAASLLGYIGYDSTKKDCMVWVDNSHYKLTSCDIKHTTPSILKDSYVLENLRRITPDSTYQFFKINGKENLWYEKNNSGDLEYFTSYGVHPITGETLKKMTPYIIKKYIWKTFKP